MLDLRTPHPEQVQLDDIKVHVNSTAIHLPLHAKPLGLSPERLGLLWHAVHDLAVIWVTVAGLSEVHRKVKMHVRSLDRRFQVRWAKWNPNFRSVSDLKGGAAVEALDDLDESKQVLTYYLMGDETRKAGLEFCLNLDEFTRPGEYKFEVVVESVGEKPQKRNIARITCTLNLYHVESKLLWDLPSIYEDAMRQLEDEEESEIPPFFTRFLRGFEDTIEPLQATLSALDSLFGPFSTPPDFLLWLGAWVCTRVDENWSEMKRRQLVSEAVELYRWRGTKRGLSRYLEIYTGAIPFIEDLPCVGMRLGREAKLNTPYTILGDIPHHTFVVTLAVPSLATVNEEIIREIIRYEKPAHTGFRLHLMERRNPIVSREDVNDAN